MKEYTSIQLSREMKKKLRDMKFELKILSFEEIIEALLKIKKVIFIIEREGAKREISGIQLYDKLIQGWKIKSYKTK